jgi:lycopene cyclase domain-containing protein
MGVLYLLALLVSLTGMVVLDRRFRLFFWADARRAAIILPVGIVFFLVWDLFGIGLGIFFRGETAFMTGLQVAHELPVEEVFFLALLSYVTMNVFGAARRILGERDAAGSATGSATGSGESAA